MTSLLIEPQYNDRPTLLTMKSTRQRRGSATPDSPNDRHVHAISARPGDRGTWDSQAGPDQRTHWRDFADGQSFLKAAASLAAGAVVIFDPLPDTDTVAVVAWLAQHRPDCAAIVVSGDASIAKAVGCLKAGAVDFLPASTAGTGLAAALSAVFVPPQDRQTRSMALRRHWIAARLSQRELEVLRELVAGLSNKSIGAKLSISERTVEVHRSRIMRRLEVDSFAHLVRMAVLAGLDSA
jgi:FixJ family two-component response regulator